MNICSNTVFFPHALLSPLQNNTRWNPHAIFPLIHISRSLGCASKLVSRTYYLSRNPQGLFRIKNCSPLKKLPDNFSSVKKASSGYFTNLIKNNLGIEMENLPHKLRLKIQAPLKIADLLYKKWNDSKNG